MKRTGDQFLAGPRFPADEHTADRVLHRVDGLENLDQFGCLADNPAFLFINPQPAFQALDLPLEEALL
jgi:hypothetical protein